MLMITLMKYGINMMELDHITVYVYELTWTQSFLVDGLEGKARSSGCSLFLRLRNLNR